MRTKDTIAKLAAAVLCSVLFLFAAGKTVQAAEAERIDNFDAVIQINSDASLSVAERIDYDFGPAAIEHHGIHRNIPIRYEARGGRYALRMDGISVTDEKGYPYEFQVYDQGDDRVIKIGSADLRVEGKKTYVISYRIRRAINYFDNHDELYWNATGNEWQVPIMKTSVRVLYPKNLSIVDTRIECFAGPEGSKSPCPKAVYVYADDEAAAGADFFASELAAGAGLTVLASVPKGMLYQPTWSENLLEDARDNLILLLPLLVFIIMYLLWRKQGRDPQGRGTIIPEFDVPDRLTPAEAGTIVDERCGQKEVVAEIIDLAVRGYVKIRRIEKEKILGSSTDYVFEKMKDDIDLSEKFDQDIMRGLFGRKKVVQMSDLKQKFYEDYGRATKHIYAAVSDKGYFAENPRSVFSRYAVLAVAMLLLVFFSGPIMSFGSYGIVSFLVSAAVILAFAFLMPRKTERGVLAKEHILGLKQYLVVAEKDRLEFHNAPAKSPEQFEKLLPYAIALGVEKEWAGQFEDIYDKMPPWYEDAGGSGVFNAVLFADSLGNFKSSFAASAMTAASSGNSGLGGGGFSGGGFGGGGGGSW